MIERETIYLLNLYTWKAYAELRKERGIECALYMRIKIGKCGRKKVGAIFEYLEKGGGE